MDHLVTARCGNTEFRWGERTYVMGGCNLSPGSFSGDGLLQSRITAGGQTTTYLHDSTGSRLERIGLVENGGDPEQDGSFFEVTSVDTIFAELKGKGLTVATPKVHTSEHGAYRAFFVVAPDGLCYMIGEPVP